MKPVLNVRQNDVRVDHFLSSGLEEIVVYSDTQILIQSADNYSILLG